MLINNDNIQALKEIKDNTIDSIVTDPPYGISFMGKSWDYDVPNVETWKELMRVLKPGGHILVACGTRTQHRMAVNIEDAGFEIRDIVAYVYGSGFPKSLNIGKVADKFLKTGNASWNGTGDSSNGALGYSKLQHKQGYRPNDYSNKHQNKLEITEEDAKKWEGWGTALKPAMELWTLARKPLSEKTVAENVLKWGTGGINIDGCRVEASGKDLEKLNNEWDREWNTNYKTYAESVGGKAGFDMSNSKTENKGLTGRFPANFIHDGSDEVVSMFPNVKTGSIKPYISKDEGMFGMMKGKEHYNSHTGDSGSASRFFYTAKASKSERNAGLDGFEVKQTVGGGGGVGNYLDDVNSASGKYGSEKAPNKNHHPTIKPISLMRYLTRLITPKGGVVLDPYMGSGTTGIACKLEGFNFIGIEIDKEYYEIAKARIENAK